MAYGVASKHGAMSIGGRAQRTTVALGQTGADDVPICTPNPLGSKEARALLKTSVVPDTSARTINTIVAGGSLPDAASTAFVAAICGSSHRVMAERNMSASTAGVRTSGGSEGVTVGRGRRGNPPAVAANRWPKSRGRAAPQNRLGCTWHSSL
eukprot:scaffold6861_cov120-Isochrysis_galbana.AAC.8